jgi:hypothetical protein
MSAGYMDEHVRALRVSQLTFASGEWRLMTFPDASTAWARWDERLGEWRMAEPDEVPLPVG